MKWRTEVDLAFNTEADAVAFLNLLQEIKSKLFTGTGAEAIPIIGRCRYHECFHDEIPPKQCGNYVNYDLKDGVKVDVKTKSGDKISADELLKKGA